MRGSWRVHWRLTIGDKLFKNNGKLVNLDLDTNKITTIPRKTFYNLVDLEILLLDNNLLTEVPVYLFRNNKKLRCLDLRWNNLSEENKKEIRLAYSWIGRCDSGWSGLCL